MPFNNGTPTGTLFVQTADATIASSAAETTLTAAGVGSLTLPANFFRTGKTIRVRARGYVSDTGTPTFRVKIKLGSTIVLDTTAIAFAGTIANDQWFVEGIITCRTTGASGTVMGQGSYSAETNVNSNRAAMTNTATTTIDTTASQAVDVTWQWGTSSASNTITCSNLLLEALDGNI
jgi:acyl-coenzyme A thioesterase PaaI-like protein